MKELSARSDTLPPTPVLSMVSSQGFSTEQTQEMKRAFAAGGAIRKVKC